MGDQSAVQGGETLQVVAVVALFDDEDVVGVPDPGLDGSDVLGRDVPVDLQKVGDDLFQNGLPVKK